MTAPAGAVSRLLHKIKAEDGSAYEICYAILERVRHTTQYCVIEIYIKKNYLTCLLTLGGLSFVVPNYFAFGCPTAFPSFLRLTASGFTVHTGDGFRCTTAKEDARQLHNQESDTESFSAQVVDNTRAKDVVLKVFAQYEYWSIYADLKDFDISQCAQPSLSPTCQVCYTQYPCWPYSIFSHDWHLLTTFQSRRGS